MDTEEASRKPQAEVSDSLRRALAIVGDDPVFATPHGSRLYGLHSESSDYDWFIVTNTTSTKTKHTVSEDRGPRRKPLALAVG